MNTQLLRIWAQRLVDEYGASSLVRRDWRRDPNRELELSNLLKASGLKSERIPDVLHMTTAVALQAMTIYYVDAHQLEALLGLSPAAAIEAAERLVDAIEAQFDEVIAECRPDPPAQGYGDDELLEEIGAWIEAYLKTRPR
jgi:hypothetical protein